MKRRVLIIISLLLTFQNLVSQTDTTITKGDTITDIVYQDNGQILRIEKMVIGRDDFSYENYKRYYENGNPKWISYRDVDKDTLYYLSGRENGSIDFQDITSKGNYERIRQNKKGQLIERSTSHDSSKTHKVETFKNGLLKKVEFEKKYIYKDKYDTVYCYSGGITGFNHIVVINDKIKIKDYDFNRWINIGGELYPNSIESNSYLKSRQKKHFYQEYSNDSTLGFEGIFKNFNLPVGWYKEYHPNGILKSRGYFNKKGRMNSVWRFYDNEGIFIQQRIYTDGEIFKH